MNAITEREFQHFQRFIFEAAGITLSPGKKSLVSGRLSRRLAARRLGTFSEYIDLLARNDESIEVQTAIDLLTTNETFFFREPKHFDHLRATATAAPKSQPFRVWSAASSTGEEAYSIAMVLSDCRNGAGFEVVGTDISTRVLKKARTGLFVVERTRHIPQNYLKRFCLRGQGEYEGTVLVERSLRQFVRFEHANLNSTLSADLGRFDVIFLRNVMIYFNGGTKRDVVARVLSALKPGGFLYVGHSESLNGISTTVEQVAPSIYRKP